MKKVIIDSSSAILIYRCGMFPTLLRYCYGIIPEPVFHEVTVYGHLGSDFFSDLHNKGMISVYETAAESDVFPVSLHAGEQGVISLYYEGRGDFVLIDDRKGSAFCRDNCIPYLNAFLTIKIMFMKNLITGDEYGNARQWLVENGRYSESIILWADNADEQKLSFFLQE